MIFTISRLSRRLSAPELERTPAAAVNTTLPDVRTTTMTTMTRDELRLFFMHAKIAKMLLPLYQPKLNQMSSSSPSLSAW